MKKLAWIILIPFLFACGPSQTQLIGEQEYYKAKVAMSKHTASQPIFELLPADTSKPITLGNVGRLTVFQLPVAAASDGLRQYEHKNYSEPWIRLMTSTIGVALPWIGAWGIAHEMGKAAGDTISNYNQTVSGTGNTATVRTSTMATGNMGDGNTLTGMSEINDSYNPTTTTTTTSTDDHSTDDHSTEP